jgi:multimeric flavodoxin WrbA
MKICIINGSPKTNSTTMSLSKKLCLALSEDIIVINLREMNIMPCKGCMKCYHSEHCIINDDLENILKSIAGSDLLVYASPTYLFNISTYMKIFIDRLASWGYKSSLSGKPAVVVTTADGIGAKDCIKNIKRFIYFTGSLYISSLYSYIYEFKNKKRINKQKDICIKKINSFFKSKKYKPGIENLLYFTLKQTYIITAKKRFYNEYKFWISNQEGRKYFYPVKNINIKISFLKKIISLFYSKLLFSNYKYSDNKQGKK